MTRRPLPLSRAAVRRWIAAWLLAAVPLYGLGGLAAQLLGPLHVHATGRLPTDPTRVAMATRWLARIDHAIDHLLGHAHDADGLHVRAGSTGRILSHHPPDRGAHAAGRAHGHDAATTHAHAHEAALRHHHDPDDPAVVVVGDAVSDDDAPGVGWAWQVVAPGSRPLVVAAPAAARRWRAADAPRLDGRPLDRLERPPRA